MNISEINIYPIKSLRGISLKTAKIERRGLEFDRRWMLVNEKNEFLTQREFPKMATIETKISEDGLQVFQQNDELQISFAPNSNETARVKVWSSKSLARVYEKDVNGWFSDVLQTKCKLVLQPAEARRRVSYFYAVHPDDHVSFADAYPFLLIGENSLADLNSRLESELPMNRFRPNLVVSESGAFAEDGWKKIKIGANIFHVVKPCARCVITTINQKLGEKDGMEPLKTLADFRIPKRSVKKKILFGQNLIVEAEGGVLRVGDEVEILETKKKPDFLSV